MTIPNEKSMENQLKPLPVLMPHTKLTPMKLQHVCTMPGSRVVLGAALLAPMVCVFRCNGLGTVDTMGGR